MQPKRPRNIDVAFGDNNVMKETTDTLVFKVLFRRWNFWKRRVWLISSIVDYDTAKQILAEVFENLPENVALEPWRFPTTPRRLVKRLGKLLPHELTKSSALTLWSLQFTEQQGRHFSKSHCYVQIGTLLRNGWTPMMRQSIYYNSGHCFLWPLSKENNAHCLVGFNWYNSLSLFETR